MYIYTFNGGDHHTSTELEVLKVTEILHKYERNRKELYFCMTENKRTFNVLQKEGSVFRRSFWLEDYDMEKARSILSTYIENCKNVAYERLKRLEEIK